MSETKTHPQQLAEHFTHLDFYYQYSDDNRAYSAGRDSTNKFKKDYDELSDSDKEEFYNELKSLGKIDTLSEFIYAYNIKQFD